VRLAGAGAALAVALGPAVAWACPSCATRTGPGIGGLVLLGVMIAVPYAVAVVAIKVVRRLDRDS
jgi:hypothetical protein